MKLTETPWVRGRVLPFEPTAPIAKSRGDVLVVADEVACAVALRVNERYATTGNYPRDRHGRDLVDEWCARGSVAFAMEAAIAMTNIRQRGRADVAPKGYLRPYEIRHDGQPWWRLREHFWAAPSADRANALALAEAAWDPSQVGVELDDDLPNDLPFALAFVTCKPAWVKKVSAAALDEGYGKLCVLAAVRDPAAARKMIATLMAIVAKYQVIENGWPFIPTLLSILDDGDAALIVSAARIAWNKAVRKPWLEIAKCLPPTPDALAFLKEHDAPKTSATRSKPKR